jgi:hypothetical protein
MLSSLRRGLLCAFIALGVLCASPARAFDPMLMFLFGMAREIMYDAFVNSRTPRPENAEPLPAVYPGTMVEPAKLRELIDQSFIYLSERRREELFQALHDEIIKPKNAAVRASMIAYFAEHAVAVRTVMERLSKLNDNEMRELSAHFAAQARALPVDEREQLRKVLEEGLLPVPPDLNQRLVVAIAEIPRPPADAGPAQALAEDAKPKSPAQLPPPIAATAPREAPAPAPPVTAGPAAVEPAPPRTPPVTAGARRRDDAPAVW